jgi:hypothetical protein
MIWRGERGERWEKGEEEGRRGVEVHSGESNETHLSQM